MELTSPQEHIKNTSTCGTVLTETNWKLAERLLYNQGCEKDPQGIVKEGKRSDQSGTCAPGRGVRGKGRLHGWRSALGNEQFKPHTGCPSHGIQHREEEPHLLVESLLGSTVGMWEAWNSLLRSM